MQTKQVIITAPEKVSLVDIDVDACLQPEEFLVTKEYSFISAGTELSIYTGVEPLAHIPGSWCAYPCVRGTPP